MKKNYLILIFLVLSAMNFNCAAMAAREQAQKQLWYTQSTIMDWAPLGVTKAAIEGRIGRLRVLYSSVDALGTWETCEVYGIYPRRGSITASFRNGILVDISKY